MHGQELFLQAFVFLLAAVVAVPVAQRLGLGSVLGYLLAGIVIGPFVLGLVHGAQGQEVMGVAEFGVVMMLFVIGLELEPKLLWRLRRSVLGLGGLQVGATALVVAAVGAGLGLGWQAALAVGLTLALSSTAIVLQTLEEKGLRQTDGGQNAFAVLLFQDIAVIPILALLPLLATMPEATAGGEHHRWIEDLPPLARTGAVLAAVAGIVVAGRYLLRPVFRYIGRARLIEVFTAAALVLVIGIALLMNTVGLSPALGTFVAGVVLASSEYRHELEADIAPFKGLLLGVFFIAVGASIDFALIGSQPATVAGLVVLLIAIKLAVLGLLGRRFGMSTDQNLVFTFALAQSGEFAFVLFAFATRNGVIPTDLGNLLIAVVAVSMALTPVLILVNERLILPRFGTRERDDRPADDIHGAHPVIIAGFGQFGSMVARLLRSQGIEATVLEYDSDRVDVLRKLGFEVYYGDATRLDLLRVAGAERARLLIAALGEPVKNRELVSSVRKHFPHLEVLARAEDRFRAYELIEDGERRVYRETLDTALRMGADALTFLGIPAHRAYRLARTFRRHDDAALEELAGMRRDQQRYLNTARQRIEQLEEVLSADAASRPEHVDAAWDVESLKREILEARPGESLLASASPEDEGTPPSAGD